MPKLGHFCVRISDNLDFRQLGPPIWMLYSPNFRQKKVSEIGTVWEWDTFFRAPKFECPDFRGLLYYTLNAFLDVPTLWSSLVFDS